MSATQQFIKRLDELIREDDLFPRDARIVIGVSGGADSMVLLHALDALNKHCAYGLSLHVAHLNHCLRKEAADEDAAFVEAAADALQLPRTIETRDVAALCAKEKGSIEEVARRERYTLFERASRTHRAGWIALAHHADDNVETVLHRLLRGTGLRGVSGIAPSRPLHRRSNVQVVRPFLRFTRREILRYMQDEGHAYREDSTNASLDTTRNRIRNALLPQLESEFNPQVRDAILRLSEQARWANTYISSTVQRLFETLVISRTDQELVLNAHAISRKDRIVQTELIRTAIAFFEIGEQDLTFAHLKAVTDMIADNVSGRSVTLPRGMTARLVYSRLVLEMPTDEPRESIAEEIAVHVPGRTVLPVRRLVIECDIFRTSERDIRDHLRNRNPFEEWVDLDEVCLPLVVRSRHPGDRFWPLGAPGSKTIGDFLTDAKVDPAVRERVAVLCDRLGPVWIIGQRIDDRVKLTRITREVLRLRAHNLDD